MCPWGIAIHDHRRRHCRRCRSLLFAKKEMAKIRSIDAIRAEREREREHASRNVTLEEFAIRVLQSYYVLSID